MKSTKIGYARCSTDKQDLSARIKALIDLGISEDQIYTEHGLTGTNRERPGLDQAIAHAKGKLKSKQPKLSEKQQRELVRMHATGEYSISDLAKVFSVSRPTVYRTLQRAKGRGLSA